MKQNRLAILIPSLIDRMDSWAHLLECLGKQINEHAARDRIKIFSNIDNGQKTIGTKRNELIQTAIKNGFEYVVFFDDDDVPGENYIKNILKGMDLNVDVVSLRGVLTNNGNNPEIFEHSIKYKTYKTNENGSKIKYERYPNHLNCMKLEIAKQFPFPEINHGEDTNFATQVFKSGLLKKEYYSDNIVYHYQYQTK